METSSRFEKVSLPQPAAWRAQWPLAAMRRIRGAREELVGTKRSVLAWALVVACAAPGLAQTVSGTAFEDRNADGIRDPGEPALPAVSVTLFGTRDAGGAIEQTVPTAPDGTFSLAPGNGCYLLGAVDPAGFR